MPGRDDESRFRGFPREAMDFYAGLEADNSKVYWERNRGSYESAVRAPMEALVELLPETYGTFKIFRPYRDVRFSRDKSPYKTQCGAASGTERGAVYYVHVSSEGVLAAAGMYQMARDQIERFRAAVADESSGPELERLIARGRSDKLQVGPGMEPALATAPRGYPKDHPRIELLRWKGCVTMAETGAKRTIGSSKLRDWILDQFEASTPLVHWLEDCVGATTEERARR